MQMRKRIVMILAVIAMSVSVAGLARIATKTNMSLLYAGLETGAAGDVIKALEQHGVAYQIRGGAIYVDALRRDELRMTLASEGLPENSTSGYELLDTLSGFGTTSQMFDAAYWRAKEGELARTIMANAKIRSARVHISTQPGRSFRKSRLTSASVTVVSAGGALSTGQANALKFLVSSAVSGLQRENVSVIDGRSGLVLGGGEENMGHASTDDREEALKQSVQRLLEARVGYGNAVVELSLETEQERQSISERIFDPNSRVAISTDSEERSTKSDDVAGGGSVTVASNLPDGAGGADGKSSSENSETRERVNYEVSETKRETLRLPGAIRKISVAVLVDGTTAVAEDGEQSFSPRSDEELGALRELVASAIGFDEARGDTIVIKSLEFDTASLAEPTAQSGAFLGGALDVMSLIQIGVLAVVALVLGFFVVRPVMLNTVPEATVGMLASTGAPESPSGQVAAIEGSRADAGTLITHTQSGPQNIDVVTSGTAPSLATVQVLPESADFGFGNMDYDALDIPETGGRQSMAAGLADLPEPVRNPVEKLRQLVEERQEEAIEILRVWLEDEVNEQKEPGVLEEGIH